MSTGVSLVAPLKQVHLLKRFSTAHYHCCLACTWAKAVEVSLENTSTLSCCERQSVYAGRPGSAHGHAAALLLQASTVCADPLTKFVEVCSLSQSVAWNSSSTTLNNSWPERIR